MSKKGSWKGACFTPGCASDARWIANAEAARVEVPQERYRCTRCCDLIGLAVPERRDDVYPGRPGWDEWCAELDAIFALPLSALEKASAGAAPNSVYVITGPDLDTIAHAFRQGNPTTVRLEFRRDGVAVKFDAAMWTPTLGTVTPRE